jgi:hypothetical protein
MKSISVRLAGALLAVTVMLGACATPPTEEMNRALEAVTRAENDADALLYAANTLARARAALNRMQTEANSKRYNAAKTAAAEAVSAAEQAIADGRAGAARTRDEAAALVTGLRPAIAETDQGLKSARAAKLPLDFNALGEEFDTARLYADQAELALAAAQYQEAMERCRNAQAVLSGVNQKLSESVLVTSRKK